MIRQIIIGLVSAFAALGCTGETGDQNPTNDEANGSDERVATDEICGGFAGLQCKDGLYCDFPPATNCGSGDQTGVCTVPPEACTKIYAPVCGCDGNTYGNACEASRAKVSVRREGEC
jgi:hypothetical protein